ncbi:hypothetical protein HHI36_011616 [Cryptolaemus montrouzieri]|uniref:Uncharacterized protein n=1 Tax=Cryptolaemus montrouzieri TaxID=559131 RepID=A0ABD2MMB0_9CUCU
MNKWRQVIKGACMASQIGHCHSRDSFKKQQNLQKAMIEAKKLAIHTPVISRPVTPISLPDITGSNILNIIGETTNTSGDLIQSKSLKSSGGEPDLINLESQKLPQFQTNQYHLINLS